MDQVLYRGRGEHSQYRVVERVYDGRPSRLLLSGKAAPQSGIALDDNPELLFDYNQRLLEVVLSVRPERVLVIGGGACTLPMAIAAYIPDAAIDIVEMESLLARLASEYFDFSESDRMKLIIQDGREFIEASQSQYDLIIVDAFDEYTIPRPLVTVQAAQQYARLLAPGGCMAMNVIAAYTGGRPTLIHRIVASFRDVFSTTELYPADPYYGQRGDQNILFIAAQQPTSLEYLQTFRVEPTIAVDDQLKLVE